MCALLQCFNIYFIHISATVIGLFASVAVRKTEASSERHWRETSFDGSDRADCNEAPGALPEQRQKTPLESFALTGEVPILLSSPSGFDALSGPVLLLATDQ